MGLIWGTFLRRPRRAGAAAAGIVVLALVAVTVTVGRDPDAGRRDTDLAARGSATTTQVMSPSGVPLEAPPDAPLEPGGSVGSPAPSVAARAPRSAQSRNVVPTPTPTASVAAPASSSSSSTTVVPAPGPERRTGGGPLLVAGSNNVQLVQGDGGVVTTCTTGALMAQWSPDRARFLQLTLGADGSTGPLQVRRSDCSVVATIAGGGRSADGRPVMDLRATWSPNGRFVAFTRWTNRVAVHVADAATGAEAFAPPPSWWTSDPWWSPTGELLAVSASNSTKESFPPPPMDAAVLSPDGIVTLLTTDAASASATYTPAGWLAPTRPLFTRSTSSGRSVIELPTDGRAPRTWSTKPGTVSVAPDRASIFIGGGDGLWRIGSDGSEGRVLSTPSGSVSWSPTTDLASTAPNDRLGELIVFRPDGTVVLKVPATAMSDNWGQRASTSWSPDGTLVAWVELGTNGDGRVLVLHPDGTLVEAGPHKPSMPGNPVSW